MAETSDEWLLVKHSKLVYPNLYIYKLLPLDSNFNSRTPRKNNVQTYTIYIPKSNEYQTRKRGQYTIKQMSGSIKNIL